MRRALPILALGGVCFLCAAAQPPPVSQTQHIDFPAGGTLLLKDSIGELTIQGWDRPDLEITTIPIGGSVRVTAQRQGDQVVVTTVFPKHRALLRPFAGLTDVDLEYRIKVPRAARVTVHHQGGEVHIDNIAGDLNITDRMGQITVNLSPQGQYSIDARSKLGAIDSDVPGREQRKLKFGHAFIAGASSASQKLYLRVGFGDITILQTSRPPQPAPLPQP